ncbi:expressed unknown protein [Seminavis robusta]|uniref:Uncharacterized protein n=1 Tax=Seminavis robusta TaxID=568900 RepID=A0A9N8DWL3_9STRA|nr:expressed unknown protein [Seminavis robusta]|eukprot:Sro407_g136570.1 n/a (125) ;mRNA; r:13368-13742
MFVSWDKTNQLTFGSTKLPPDHERVNTFVDQDGLAWKMITWWDAYLGHTHPDQVSFYAYPMTDKERQKENAAMKLRDIEYNAQNPHDPKQIVDYDIWYKPANVAMNRHPGNIGHNAITTQFKKL